MARSIYEGKVVQDIQEYLNQSSKQFKEMIDRYSTITIVTHIYPDADTIGTALGLANILKESGKRVEVVNISKDIPRNLDFLEGFERIKRRVEYKNSLMISCDCGDIDRLGVDTKEHKLINIDHHIGNTLYGDLNIILPQAVSASEVAYRVVKPIMKITPQAATAFYTALISDTQNFTTNSVNKDTFKIAFELVNLGADVAYITKMLFLRRSLSSLRLLSIALSDLELFANGKIGLIRVTQSDIKRTNAVSSDLDGIVDYAKSLVTVEVAILAVEYEDVIKVSLRSKNIDILPVATHFGGGGHKFACGFIKRDSNIDNLTKELVEYIKEQLNQKGVK